MTDIIRQNNVIIIDGGFSTQLTCHIGQYVDGDPLWSARFTATNPNAVIATHMDFLNAGADAILTNTYQASIAGFMEYLHLTKDDSINLIKTAVKLAHTAREKYLLEQGKEYPNILESGMPWVIGSIGPYGAYLHNGSEYTGNYADYISKTILKEWHRPRMNAIIQEKVDALAIETIPCAIEAEAIIELLCDEYPHTKFWISFQCKDGKSIAHGEIFTDTVFKIWQLLKEKNAIDNVLAIGVNCLHPKYVTALFKSVNGELPRDKRIPLIVYPNSGEVYDIQCGWGGKEDCIPLENYVSEWIDLNTKIIGGCCRTYAHDIKRIKSGVQKFFDN